MISVSASTSTTVVVSKPSVSVELMVDSVIEAVPEDSSVVATVTSIDLDELQAAARIIIITEIPARTTDRIPNSNPGVLRSISSTANDGALEQQPQNVKRPGTKAPDLSNDLCLRTRFRVSIGS